MGIDILLEIYLEAGLWSCPGSSGVACVKMSPSNSIADEE